MALRPDIARRHRRGALVRRGIRAETEQAQRQRRDRAPARRLAEVEDLRGMHGDAAFARSAAHRVDEARLADAGFAAHDDGASVTAGRASIERRENHRELRTAADERLRARADFAAQSLQAPREHRLGVTGLRTRRRDALLTRSPSDARNSSEIRISPSAARAASVCATCVGRPVSGKISAPHSTWPCAIPMRSASAFGDGHGVLATMLCRASAACAARSGSLPYAVGMPNTASTLLPTRRSARPPNSVTASWTRRETASRARAIPRDRAALRARADLRGVPPGSSHRAAAVASSTAARRARRRAESRAWPCRRALRRRHRSCRARRAAVASDRDRAVRSQARARRRARVAARRGTRDTGAALPHTRCASRAAP